MHTALNEAVRYINAQNPTPGKGARFTFGFEEKYTPKDGGSAGAAFALLMDSFLSQYTVAPDVAITGDISAEGTVLKVGGIPEKIDGAAAVKTRIVLVPEANTDQVADMLVLHPPEILTSIQIIALNNLETARALARQDRAPETEQSLALFEEIRTGLSSAGTTLRDPAIQEKLTRLTTQMPNHLSARYLVLQGQGRLPRHLSLDGSLDALFDSAGPVLTVLTAKEIKQFPRLSRNAYQNTLKDLNALAHRIDPRTKTLHLELIKFLNQWERMEAFDARDQRTWQNMVNEWLETRSRIGQETSRLTQDPEYIRKVVQGADSAPRS